MRIVFKTSYDQDIGMFRHRAQAVWYILLLAVMLTLPLFIGSFLIGEVTNMLIWAIAGMGLMILVGQTGQASLGHAAFLAIGAYANVILQQRVGLPFLVTFPLAGLIAGAAGVLLAIPTTRLHGIYLAIATLAVSILVEDLIVIAEPLTGGVAGMFASDISIFGYSINRYIDPNAFYWLALAVTLMVVYFYRNLLRSPRQQVSIITGFKVKAQQRLGIRAAQRGTPVGEFGAAAWQRIKPSDDHPGSLAKWLQYLR